MIISTNPTPETEEKEEEESTYVIPVNSEIYDILLL